MTRTVLFLLSSITVKILLFDLASDIHVMTEFALVTLITMSRFEVDTEYSLRI